MDTLQKTLPSHFHLRNFHKAHRKVQLHTYNNAKKMRNEEKWMILITTNRIYVLCLIYIHQKEGKPTHYESNNDNCHGSSSFLLFRLILVGILVLSQEDLNFQLLCKRFKPFIFTRARVWGLLTRWRLVFLIYQCLKRTFSVVVRNKWF